MRACTERPFTARNLGPPREPRWGRGDHGHLGTPSAAHLGARGRGRGTEAGSTVRSDGEGFGSDGVAACGCPGAGVRPGTNGVRERGFGTLKYEQLYRHETR